MKTQRLLSLIGSLVSILLLAGPASAATYTVNDSADPGNGVCNSGSCTLSEAISAANSNSGADTIVFDFSSATTITLTGDLPDVSGQTTINGYSCGSCGATEQTTGNAQDGLTGVLGITIEGLSGSSNPVLHFTSSATASVVKGLNIQGADGDGIEIEADDMVVSGCFIGTSLDGLTAQGNNDGVWINGAADVVVGPYNLLSGNSGEGIEVDGDKDRTIVVSNLIGTNVTGTAALGNSGRGIYFDASGDMRDVEVGDGTIGGANVISGNGSHGIEADGQVRGTDASNRSLIAFNFIGTNGAGTAALGNTLDGIHIDGNTDDAQFWAITDNVISGNGDEGIFGTDTQKVNIFGNYIGTNSAGANLGNTSHGIHVEADNDDKDAKKYIIGGVGTANVIAFNGGNGITLTDSGGSKENKQTTIGVNSIHSNVGIGIDLRAASSGSGPSAGSCTNDTAWGNRRMARPVITTADLTTATNLDLVGTACADSTVDIYVADGDGTGYGEPMTYLGTTTSTSGGAWSVSLVVSGVVAGTEVTALASDTSGDPETGEAALNVTVTGSCVDGDSDGVTTCGADGLAGTTADNDCDDADAANYPGNTEVCDAGDNDCDTTVDEGFDVDGDGVTTCGADGDAGITADNDCDDADIDNYPGNTEVCDAGDNDCDTTVDEGFDVDGDGVTTCGADGDAGITTDNDCDDADATTYPSATEICDGADNNCDGGVPATETDDDGDGQAECEGDCDDADIANYDGNTESCDLQDNDCDTLVDEGFDADGDGASTCDGDCDDANAAINPTAAELCDGIDNDCNGSADFAGGEGDGDGDGALACEDCDDAEPLAFPGNSEVCGDGIDNDCDGTTDVSTDADGDGVDTCSGDCDDSDPTVFPGNTEVCDGADNNCDLTVDEGFDADGDGFATCGADGDPLTVGDNDCDDGDAATYPGGAEFCDAIDSDCDGSLDEDFDVDGDGYTTCGADGNALSTGDNDCDDGEAATNPGATEVCDAVDNNCDGATDEPFDVDQDLVTTCGPDGDVLTLGDNDCDDGASTTYPGAAELCDGVDNDCNGVVPPTETDDDGDGQSECNGDCDDADSANFTGNAEICDLQDNNCNSQVDEGFDGDADGFSSCDGDCNDSLASINPNAAELCDGIDNDCNGSADFAGGEGDADGDGALACEDCDDAEPLAFPGNSESCGDGIDNDCDGTTDVSTDNDGDGVDTCSGDCDDNDAAVFPGQTETCNGIDDDCDLTIDNGFDVDGDGVTTCGADGTAGNGDDDCDDADIDNFPGNTETCDGADNDCDGLDDDGFDLDADGVTTCGGDGVSGTSDDDCDDAAAASFPGNPEVCDGIDNDCNGSVDDGLDADNDGVSICGPDGISGTADDDCDDGAADVYPGAPELCDLVDNDCDGDVDEGSDLDADADGFTACEGDCDDTNASINPEGTEVCNGLDDNCDGTVDEGFDADDDGFTTCGDDGIEGTDDDDCDDDDEAVSPGEDEICGDGIDQNCDGVDSVDFDGDGWVSTDCDGEDCDDENPDVNPDAEEICDDGIDNDCDGQSLDTDDLDGDGITSCDGDCDDLDDEVAPDLPEVCDGIDNDCNGEIDEINCGECDDLDEDGYEDAACGGEDCDDSDLFISPGAPESCEDGIDNNCDGEDAPCISVDLEAVPQGCDCEAAVSPGPSSGVALFGLLLGAGLRRRRRPGAPTMRDARTT
ncbi:MAG: hypothetical protein KDA24_02520 [Deltaproteobacteria bacterium]|nr:hypothetical protein [Deltaproteobacteria bacterium]